MHKETEPILEVYKASAGAGKTFTLAYRYICLLLGRRVDDAGHIRLYTPGDRRRHREILAITFTNKATAEMKQRIVSNLFQLTNPASKSKFKNRLKADTGADDFTLAHAASEALKSLLFDFGGMQVSTIDAFFQRILRSFAYEADLTGNYELMLDNKRMIQMAISETMAIVCGMRGTGAYSSDYVKRLRNWVQKMLNFNAEAAGEIKIFDKDSSLRKGLTRFVKDLSGENFHTISHRLEPFFDAPDAIDNLLTALNARLDEIDKRIASLAACINPSQISENALKMLARIVRCEYEELTSTNLNFVSGERTDYASFLNKDYKKDEALLDIFSELFPLVRARVTVALMIDRIFNLGLFNEVLQVASQMKIHMNTIMLSDTNTLLNKIISGSDTPFIYERIGQQLHHFLIDEFQDTSKLQWLNLHPLIVNSLANGSDNMIIGDVKQCIYRFRNSYPGLLDTELQADDELSHAIVSPSLPVNFRSSIDVVDFNNRLFKQIASMRSIRSYAEVEQDYDHDNPKDGYVNLVVSKTRGDGLDRMVEHMQRQLRSGYRPGDLAVLVRFNRDADSIVARLLAESQPGGALEGVQVVSDEALYVRSAKSVQFIVARLREFDRIQRDEDDIPINPRTGLPPTTERELEWLNENLGAMQGSGSTPEENIEELLKRFDERNHIAALPAETDPVWRKKARGRSVFEVVEEIVMALPDARLKVDEAQYIAAFQDLVIDYCRTSTPSVHGFLQLWDDRLEEEAAVGLSESVNAIRILTIHKAKGLQFNCVHIPDLNASMNVEKGHSWYRTDRIAEQTGLPKDVLPDFYPLDSKAAMVKYSYFAPQLAAKRNEVFLDELNALYVAFTRAEFELIVTATSGKDTPAALITEALAGASLSEWEYTQGNPTVKLPPDDTNSAPDLFAIKEYSTYPRLDHWHKTNVDLTDL